VAEIFAWRTNALLEGVREEELPGLLADPDTFLWVDIGPGETAVAERLLQDVLRLHPLVVEDCLSPNEQPKIDDYGDYLFVVTHGIRADAGDDLYRQTELDAILGPRHLITYHATESQSVTATKESVRRTGLPLKRGPAAVLHEILDRQIDRYLLLLEDVERHLGEIEEAVFERPTQPLLEEMLTLKRAILGLRRSLLKQREVLHRLGRREFSLIPQGDSWLFRDVEDHLGRAADLLESYREILADAVQIYLSVTSNRLNEIVKVLTIFSSIMLPLSLIAGIYGMNFKHMPELEWRMGYPFALAIMATVALGLLAFFWRKGWLMKRRPSARHAAAPSVVSQAARLSGEARRRIRSKRLSG